MNAAAVEKGSKDDSLTTAMRRYRDSRDLRAFYDRAREVGGVGNLWAAQAVLLRCARVGIHGSVTIQQEMAATEWNDGAGTAREDAYREWLLPCAGFETRPTPQGESARVLFALRDSAGLVGEGYRIILGRGTKDEPTAAELRSFVRRMLESGEPELLTAFADRAVEAHLGRFRTVEGAEAAAANARIAVEERAWRLASCELGVDCSKGSTEWLSACFSSGDCSDGNLLKGVAADLGKESVPEVTRRRDEILAAVKARDWAALGLAP